MPPRDSVFNRVARSAVVCVGLACLAHHASALTITAGYEASITGSSNSAAIESSIQTAVSDVGKLYSNPGDVSILFATASGNFLGQSNSGIAGLSYSTYTQALAIDAAYNPANQTLATALANLGYGNDANGARPIAVTTALLRVGLGDIFATPCFDRAGALVSSCGGTSANAGIYDGIVTLSNSTSTPLSYTSRVVAGEYDAVRVVEHEVDEILGGGGGGSTLNDIASAGGINKSSDLLSYYDGPLDLYRYSAAYTPSFTTSGSATSYLSVNGGVTSIVGFNQSSTGDYADFQSSGCIADVQVAFTCAGQQADETITSPEYQMMLSIGWDPVPEPTSVAILSIAIGGLAVARRRRMQVG